MGWEEQRRGLCACKPRLLVPPKSGPLEHLMPVSVILYLFHADCPCLPLRCSPVLQCKGFCSSSFPPILKTDNHVSEPALFILAQKIEFYQLGSVSEIARKGLLLVLLSGTPLLFKEKPN